MYIKRLAVMSFAAATACGCAVPSSRAPMSNVPDQRCEDVVAEGLASREAAAKKIAKEGVTQQLADARGNLLALGLHSIRGTSYETRCRPHTLGLGLVKCTAVARLCGR